MEDQTLILKKKQGDLIPVILESMEAHAISSERERREKMGIHMNRRIYLRVPLSGKFYLVDNLMIMEVLESQGVIFINYSYGYTIIE